MNSFWKNFFDPENSLVRFIIGTAALTVAIQILYDLFKEPFGLVGTTGLALFLILLVVAIFWFDYTRRQRYNSSQPVEKSNVPPHKGLILLVSPGNTEIAEIAIKHHETRLQHCWLLSSLASLPTADELESKIHQKFPEVVMHSGQEYVVDPEAIESTWQIAENIYQVEAPYYNLTGSDVLADITGGLKPMTAGLALACSIPDRKMQYIKTLRGPDGAPIKDAPRIPVLISTRQISVPKDLP